MTAVDEITAAIAKLPPDELSRVRAWLAAQDAAAWDEQIERDVAAGRLDPLVSEARAEHAAGRTKSLRLYS